MFSCRRRTCGDPLRRVRDRRHPLKVQHGTLSGKRRDPEGKPGSEGLFRVPGRQDRAGHAGRRGDGSETRKEQHRDQRVEQWSHPGHGCRKYRGRRREGLLLRRLQLLRPGVKEIYPKLHNINLLLIYRASEDGDRAKDFHKKCDKIGPNLVIIKTRKGNIFGGFTSKNWEHMPRDIDEKRPNLGSASRDSKAFGFNINNQKIYINEKPNEFAIWCNKNYGPTFKNNLFQIFDSCLKKGGYCSVRNNSHFGGQMFDYEIAGGESRFRVDELEVFEIKTK